MTDKVQLPRIYLAWLTPPHFAPGDAALDMVADALAGGKNSRLYKRLVYEMQIAQDVQAYQASQQLSSYFLVQATARPGHSVDELMKVIDEEIVKLQTVTPRPARDRTFDQHDRGVVLQAHGAGRRLRRQSRSAQRLLHDDRRSRLLQRGSRPISGDVAVRRSRRRDEVPAARSTRGADRSAGRSEVRMKRLIFALVCLSAVVSARKRPIARILRHPVRRRALKLPAIQKRALSNRLAGLDRRAARSAGRAREPRRAERHGRRSCRANSGSRT